MILNPEVMNRQTRRYDQMHISLLTHGKIHFDLLHLQLMEKIRELAIR